jgi:acyl transferase domain-containing protein/phosphopantetheinyl transferase
MRKSRTIHEPIGAGEGHAIAVIGMACLFPAAPDLDAYWRNIVSKIDAVTDPPEGTWWSERFYDPDVDANDRMYCRRGGYLGSLAQFDPLAHGVLPVATESGEPDQWLALKVARDAFRDAGYATEIPERHRTAVILGKGNYVNRGNFGVIQHGLVAHQTVDLVRALHPEYTEEDLETLRAELKRRLPRFQPDTVAALIPNITAGRIANRLDLMGPSYTVDAACASSLVALDLAVRELVSGTCDLALVGGVHITVPTVIGMVFCQLGALSRQQQIRPFDARADGTILGEGVGMIVLKRLSDAHRDGHRIYAVVKGVGTASDGWGMSVTAPRTEGAILAMERAYEEAGISPESIGLIEAHGTGTPAGDANEIRALRHVFGPRVGPVARVALGTVKSMLGHLMPAAGIAGIIKATLALYHKVLPPTLHVEEPNPEFELHKTPFYLNRETRPWMHADRTLPRRAVVNAFGFGGINAHAILEECPAAAQITTRRRKGNWDSEVFILSADSRSRLIERARRLKQWLQASPAPALKDLAYSLNCPLEQDSHRIAIVASSGADLLEKVGIAIEHLTDSKRRKISDPKGIYFTEEPLALEGQVAFLFPGEGSQYVNMCADLCMEFPEFKQPFERADRVWAEQDRGYLPSDLLFPQPNLPDRERQSLDDGIWQMDGATALVLAADDAFRALLENLEIRPDVVVGHSTGEFAALRASGMIDLGDEAAADRFAEDLYQIYEEVFTSDTVPQAALVAVGAESEQLFAAIEPSDGAIYVAMDNCPQQSIIVGEEEAVQPAVARLRGRGLLCERLPFDRPYHTPLFGPYAERLRDFFARWLVSPPKVRTYTCSTASPFPSDLERTRDLAVVQWMSRVEFRKTVQALYADGVRIFVEVGPRGNLSAFVDAILRGRPHLAVPANLAHRSGITQLNHLVAMLAVNDVPMNLDYLYALRSPHKINWEDANAPEAREPGRENGRPLPTDWPLIQLSDEAIAKLRSLHLPKSNADSATVPSPIHSRQANESSDSFPIGDEIGDSARAESTPERAQSVSSELKSARPSEHARSASSAEGKAALSPTAQVVTAHLQTMERLVAAQREIMQAYLASSNRPLVGHASFNLSQQSCETSRTGSLPGSEAQVGPVPSSHESGTQVPCSSVSPPQTGNSENGQDNSAERVSEILLRLVSERTGYPIDMLRPNLDLEADLGIDSIKRVEILGSFQQAMQTVRSIDMEALAGRRTLQEIIDALSVLPESAPDSDSLAAPEQSNGNSIEVEVPVQPLLGKIISLSPGERLTAVRDLTISEDLILRHHTFGRDVSDVDTELTGLPVVPFTVAMEMMAEAGSVLVPGKRLVGMREVRGYRWLTLDEGSLRVRIVAERKSAAAEVEARVCVDDNGDPKAAFTPIFSGKLLFADQYPAVSSSKAFALTKERPAKCASERIYEDMTFHGPLMRGVVSLDRMGDDGAHATLKVLPSSELFKSIREPAFVLDPVLLDQLGQVVGLWAMDQLGPDHIYFPFRLEELCLFGPPLAAGEILKCQVQILRASDGLLSANVETRRADGQVCVRFRGWEDRSFDFPWTVMRMMLAPREAEVAVEAPEFAGPDLEAEDYQTCRLGLDAFPDGFFSNHGAIWHRTIAHTVLSRPERRAWRMLTFPEPRRIEWLLGRIAAKDAVRRWLHKHFAIRVCPADIEIEPNVQGRPTVHGDWSAKVPQIPNISIAHCSGTALVAVGPGHTAKGVGVDIERIGQMTDGAQHAAFNTEEQKLLSGLNANEWPLRVWCAKEAAAKAIGYGMKDGPLSFVALGLDESTGSVQIRLAGEFGRQNGQPRNLTAFTARIGSWIIATCLYRPEKEQTHEARP